MWLLALSLGCRGEPNLTAPLDDGCRSCHGSNRGSAPPHALDGSTDPKSPGVGAHEAHLFGTRLMRPISCTECHVRPEHVDDPGHLDDSPRAELTFGPLASTGEAQPSWDPAALTCANYCHGATMAAGSDRSPLWTVVDGSQVECGSCHAMPPPAPHPPSTDCQLCHAPVAGPNQTIATAQRHIDGIIDVLDTAACFGCHGSETSFAPPRDLAGESALDRVTVGAHQTHLSTAIFSKPVECSSCHLVPATIADPGHIDEQPNAEVTIESWDREAATCADTYCHGAGMSGGILTTPTWTIVDGSQAACGTCHGTPPGGTHPADDRCQLCHLPTAGPNLTIASPSTHVDGVLQVAAACDSCHGESGVSAPPRDLDGEISETLPTIGAHRTHLLGGASGKPVDCSQCHLVPLELDDPGHVDTERPAEVSFGALASLGSTPSYSRSTCSNTYCHGGNAGSTPSPTWTQVDGTQAECGGCHGLPPATPAHDNLAADCSTCHLPTAGPNLTIANRSTHVDGVLQVTGLDCTTCHGDMISSAPPVDLMGALDAIDPEVGAHRVHIYGGELSAPVACTSCHLVPIDSNAPGHLDTQVPAEITFSGRAAGALVTPVFDPATRSCSDTFCHGDADPVWNVPGALACGDCHAMPPAAPHPQVDRCEVCHATAGPNHTIVDRSRHVDGVVDVDERQPCESCHGTAASPAPPADLLGLSSSPAVGAHAVHLFGTARSNPVACTECHVAVDPTSPGTAGHYDSARPAEVIFGPLARAASANPTRNGATCNNTYCHGQTLLGGSNTDPDWTDGAQSCGSCHAMPPPDDTHGGGTATQCETCHPDTAGPGQTIADASKHVNGTVDTSATCDACHGGNGDPSPPRDLAGLMASDQVGAHRAHQNPRQSAAVACATCHVVPVAYGDAGHADTPPPAEVLVDGYDPVTLECSNTYCHGVTLAGGATAVLWNDADGSESQCGACHGMPPQDTAHTGVASPNTCNTCHVDSAGPNQSILQANLHVDGVVQVSGGSCDSCHASPPAPGRESYPGSAGAHAQHAGVLGFECTTCHGNNGSGPQHDQGNGTVSRANVNLVFAPRSFAGGTTMGNASYDRNNMRCAVGCHNPRVGSPPETQNLNNVLSWTASPPGCNGCHDQVQASLPRSHDIAALGDAGCLTCHDQSQHTTGVMRIRDPDPADAFSWSANNLDGLCKTCHDGGAGTFFGNRTPPNVSPYWNGSAHGSEGFACSECHTYHASTGGPLFLDRSSQSCMAAGCHADLASTFGQVANGPISHHRIEGGTGIQLSCISCHNPHLNQAVPLAVIDPDNKWSIMSIPASARTSRRNAGDYRAFCLRCHDGSQPAGVQGALDIAAALAGGTEPSMFKKGNESLHRKEHNGYNCQNCHLSHGSPGTEGINRGRLLMSYMDVNNFPYTGEGSCGTNPNGGFSCH